jgi:predicted lysophospholipase L1 biosynthesis ABC-type transport system permease subunit
MLARLVAASLRRRFRQLALILAAVAVATATVATLAGFSARAGRLLGEDLAAFGPNLTVRPQVGGPPGIPSAELERMRALPGVRSASGIAASARAGGGQGFERVDVRADPGRLGEVARGIEAAVPGVEAKPLLRVSESDARVTRRLTLVLAAVSGVSLLLALLSVAAATTALVGERRVEIGLLLALGYTARRVGRLFAAELLAAALLAGLVGELAGELAAAGLARRLLGAAGPASAGPPATLSGVVAAAAAAVLVVGASMAMALSRVERLDAAQVLKGD